MIKYVHMDCIDDTGRHIEPINSLYNLNKTASSNYSPEVMKVILNMKRNPNLYYVVMNAVGSDEIWGSNRNGDGYPKSGLSHKSLRTDMGTINDYGYKTFEYYAKLFLHHCNKNPKNNFGDLIFAHWNPLNERVELIVGINRKSGSDIISSVENGDNVAVSIGCKVKFDICSICGNKSKTRKQYCKHMVKHMNEIIDSDTAAKWSRELNKIILPGSKVYAINPYPRFFDISKVHIGADNTSFILGKAASANFPLSVDVADAFGVTDDQIDKLAIVQKKSEIKKEVGGAISTTDMDGRVSATDKNTVLSKALDERVSKSIAAEPIIPNNILDSMSVLPLETILSTILGMGMYPKPPEFQRIIIVKVGRPDIADELQKRNMIFDYEDDNVESCPLDISNSKFSDTLGKVLSQFLEKRSCLPCFLKPRLMEKKAYYSSMEPDNDYWNQPNDWKSSIFQKSNIVPLLGGIGALYAGLKMKSMGYGSKQIANIFANKPWLRTLLGGSLIWTIQNKIDKSRENDQVFRPASDYEGILQDTNFSGHFKSASLDALKEAVILPLSYMSCATKQASLKHINRSIFPKSETPIIKESSFDGAVTGKSLLISDKSIKDLNDKIVRSLL